MDKLQINRLRDCVQRFDFKRLFVEELGWSLTPPSVPVCAPNLTAWWHTFTA
ncbi:MAG: hypothetical protein HY777_04495 [Betaproteobacteria bacterium]|nr:hypothetical protein [Betaproteobacteria bacterium]